jgi:hypothetical protein
MKVKVVTTTDSEYNQSMEIYIEKHLAFSVYDGEPEDNNLGRNFEDCFSVPELMKKAYEAGKNGQKFELYYVEEDEEY